MAGKLRTYIVDAAKRIIKSTFRGREHTVEEMVDDIKTFLDEEKEGIITEMEWQEILDQFSLVDLSRKVFQIKEVFIKKYGEKEEIQKDVKEEKEEIHITTHDPIEQEQKLLKHLQATRKRSVKKIVFLYKDMFTNVSHSPTDEELIDFISKNSLEKKENRKTVLIALSRIVGAKRILKIFDTIEEKIPYDKKRKNFDIWVQRQRGLIKK
ncbi:MAG: hypothetical protein E3J41_06150 [Candidatus Cloacimonadota bacterium]|nr:MAG: hypothetical protein E3J41_06150 [Candidatus Cloacimonadota bacterium]